MFPEQGRGTLAALLSMDDHARRHGCGGLNPALVQALTADLRFGPRAALPPQEPTASDPLAPNVVRLTGTGSAPKPLAEGSR